MKKIYFSLASIIMCGGIIAQNAPQRHLQKAVLSPNSTKIGKTTNTNSDRLSGPFSMWVEPVADVMLSKGLDLASANPNQDVFVAELFQDSTVKFSSATSTRFIGTCLIGSVLDPKSSYLDAASLEPLVSKGDSYSIDSLYIYGSYVKVTPSVDTLYAWLVWGDSSSTSIFSKRLTNQTWNPPIATWRKSVIGPKVMGAVAGAGNKIKPAAPSTNYKLIKYILTDADSSAPGYMKQHVIELDNPVTIPAGNIVSCIYTFVPGGAYVAGDVTYNLGGTSPQTINGFAASVWGQTDPAVTSLADLVDQQVDPDGWNMGVTYFGDQRHSTTASYNSITLGDLTTAPLIGYKITGTSTVSVAELESKGIALTQNMPNPANGITKIGYELTKADNVVIEVKDITGKQVLVFKNGKQNAGKYTVEFDVNQLEAGVYFYTLKTDASEITKKMSVIK